VCSLRDAAKDLESLKVRIFGISLDDVASQKHFAEGQHLGFHLLSDPDGSVAAKYGVLAEGGRYAQRVTFVIDPEGVVRLVDRAVDVSSHGSDLAAKIKELQQAPGTR
jgi:peroxiredoxin Q/BCP